MTETTNCSRTAQIEALHVGETYAAVERLPKEKNIANAQIKKRRIQLRNTVNKTTARIKEKLNRDYVVETLQVFTTTCDVLIISAVTRVK